LCEGMEDIHNRKFQGRAEYKRRHQENTSFPVEV
jgi:hypothetical protein